jgi:hypothetical protein
MRSTASILLSTLPFVSFADLFLAALSSQPHVTRNVDQRALSIMDNPAVNMKHPYVNRPLVTQWADEISASGRQSTGLYGTLAGRGKGKTRFFVELEQELNQRDGVFAVAITFGHKWHRVQPFDTTHAGMSLAVEVVLRMLAMTYRVADVDGFRKTFTTSLRRLMRHQNVFDNQLLHECIEFIIADARRGSQAADGGGGGCGGGSGSGSGSGSGGGGGGCKRFVLLIDEPMRLFASGRIDVDRFNDLCYMLLAQGNVSPDVSVRLAVTTSSADLFHATDGGGDRFSVAEMPLPTQLNIDETFTRWLPAHLPQLRTGRPIDNNGDGDGDGDGGSTERHLKRLLTLTSPLPRATQLLVETLVALFPPERPRVSLTTRLVRRVQRRLLQRLDRSYVGAAEGGAMILLNDDHLVYSLLWHQPLPLYGNVARAMVDGYIVNRPTHRGGGGGGGGGGSGGSGSNGTPPMLSALSLCRMAPYVNATTTLLKPVVEAAVHIVASTDAAAASNGLEAKALARLANALLTCRILSAERINLGAFSLWNLLLGSSGVIGGQRLSSVSPPPLLTVTRKRRTLDEYYHDVPLPLPLPHVAGSSSAYVQQLATCRLLDRDVVVVDTVVDDSDDAEARWHGLWLLRQETNGQPFVLVVAYQFHDVANANETTTTATSPTRGSGSHVAYFRDHVVSACQDAVVGTVTGGGYSDDDDNNDDDDTAVAAIAAGRFVYVTIDMRPSTGGAGPAAAGGEGDVEDDVDVVGDGDPHYVRLAGSAVRKVLTEAGVQVLDLARLAAVPPPSQ